MLLKKDVYKRNVAVRMDAVVFWLRLGLSRGCRSALNQLRKERSASQRFIRFTKLDNGLGLRRTDSHRFQGIVPLYSLSICLADSQIFRAVARR